MTALQRRGGAASAHSSFQRRELFSTRGMFIFAAMGSAVGLGNIWRFPYVAFENGGGAFIVPYLIALLCAGLPLLVFDYTIGHRYRGSAPLSLRRLLGKPGEAIGWWQVLVCVVIALYYAVVVAWAAMYTLFSFTRSWGDDPTSFFVGDFLHVSDDVHVGIDLVPGVFVPQLLVWALVLIVLVLGVKRGISMANLVLMPLLIVMFLALVVSSLFLPGAVDGLNAFFTPDWSALLEPGVWAAAVGQIFFSLSIGFGIMVTYASYLKRRSDLTGSGAVVAFANSGFELLAGIGVFAALGFMAAAQGTTVEDQAAGGVGLAFMAFPAIINAAPFGEVLGVLFFGSLTFAGLTSMISIVEVIIAAVRDKLGVRRVPATVLVVLPLAVVSLLLFPTTTGLHLLDVVDEFVNKFGILAGAFVAVVAVAWVARRLPRLRRHVDAVSSIRVGPFFYVFVGAIVPLALGAILVSEVVGKLGTVYGDYPAEFVSAFGWGMVIALPVIAIVLALLPSTRSLATTIDDAALDEAFAADGDDELERLTHEDFIGVPRDRDPDVLDADAHPDAHGATAAHATDEKETR